MRVVRVVLLLDQPFEVTGHLHPVWTYGPDQGDGFLMSLAARPLSERSAAGSVCGCDPGQHSERGGHARQVQPWVVADVERQLRAGHEGLRLAQPRASVRRCARRRPRRPLGLTMSPVPAWKPCRWQRRVGCLRAGCRRAASCSPADRPDPRAEADGGGRCPGSGSRCPSRAVQDRGGPAVEGPKCRRARPRRRSDEQEVHIGVLVALAPGERAEAQSGDRWSLPAPDLRAHRLEGRPSHACQGFDDRPADVVAVGLVEHSVALPLGEHDPARISRPRMAFTAVWLAPASVASRRPVKGRVVACRASSTGASTVGTNERAGWPRCMHPFSASLDGTRSIWKAKPPRGIAPG